MSDAAKLAEALTVLARYDAAADKFMSKVETGRAHSNETYTELRAARAMSRALQASHEG